MKTPTNPEALPLTICSRSICLYCDAPEANQEDWDTIPAGEGDHLCWGECPKDDESSLRRVVAERDELRKILEHITNSDVITDKYAVATIRRTKYPEYYMGWMVEHDAPQWTSYALDAAPVPLGILMAELNKVAAREVNAWAVIYPQYDVR